MSGRYCEKHEEWAPTGECRWCEPTEKIVAWTGGLACDPPTPESNRRAAEMWRVQTGSSQQAMSEVKLQQAMNELWVRLARENKKP